jgi:predicted metal-dependent hydrolase
VPVVEIEGRTIPYAVRRSARARRARLVAGPRDGIEVVLPARAPQRLVGELLAAHPAWLLRQSERLPVVRPLADGAALPYRGEPHTLRVRAAGRARVEHAAGELRVCGPDLREAALRRTLERWLRAEARAVLGGEVAAAERALRLRSSALAIRDQRTRWGSCSTRGTLSFSWRLVLAPPVVARYVACHEVAHLAEPNHGEGFWRLVDACCPDWRASRLWLRRHGHTLAL